MSALDPNEPSIDDEQSLLRWARWQPRSEHTLRRRPDAELAGIMRRDLRSIAPAVGTVCGATSTTMRTVARAGYDATPGVAEQVRRLAMAKTELDALPLAQRECVREVAARMNTGCWRMSDEVRYEHAGPRPLVSVAVDTPSVLASVRDMLRPFGFQVQPVEWAELIGTPMIEHRPAVVLLELLTQDGDGVALTRSLVRHNVPVVVLCGMPVASKMPAVTFLKRQFDRDALVAAVFRVLE